MADDADYDRESNDINYKSISCEQIPELFLDKLVAKKHFSKFGKINRFILRPNRLCCTVDYETEEDAANAYENAGNFNGKEFIVNYAEKEVGHVQNTEEWVDPDVQAELESMGRSITPSGMRAPASIMKPPLPLPVAKRTVRPTMLSKVSKSLLQPPPPQATVEPTTTIPKVDAAVRMELEAILRKPALTDEDKYRVLDARDKLIRLKTVRQTDIKTAVSTKGTCPDMCPEKERLMREFQRQVSTFEMFDAANNFAINHRRAIKEYSRSSADQEVPLGHELRAEPVLQMTMLYLMHNILDLCDDPQTSIADWFHFVWDRTRSIRKDITQQELCSLGAVQLVEQCARFHIHCAARLVAEDPSVFDKKINAENLTKCLQTLKYMYHDLRIKHVRCAREAEFRSYIVLLNLGDANFLWELKQLPEEIQKSVEIKRAIAFYNALQNNNYVRFFNLIRSPQTSYLSACILLGYFTKLRIKAMEAIVKSHNWRKTAVSLPLKFLIRVLGFESVDTAMNFFNSHGMQSNEEQVKLDRVKMPDMEYTMDRAMLIVESKRTTSVGECVNGQALDPPAIFEKHEPHNSFDANGYLKPDAWTADDQLRGEAAAAKKLQKEKQQQISSTGATRTSDNIFKVPLTTSPISPKQQIKQQQTFGNKISTPSATSSIFGGNYFGGDINKTEFSTPKAPSAENVPIFSSKPATNSTNIFSSGATSSDTGESIFKIPVVSSNAGIKQKPTEASSSTAFFNSIFKPYTEKTVAIPGAGIFGGNTNTSDKPLVDIGSDNIFGSAAKETANIFQQKSTAQKPTTNEPKPLQADNVFKHFNTTVPAFGTSTAAASTGIFGSAFGVTTEEQLKAELDAKKLEDARERKRQLEEEERKQLAALEKERQKLRELEEKQRQEQERRRKAEAEERKEAEHKRRLKLLSVKAEQVTQLQLESLLTDEIKHISTTELNLYRGIESRSQELTAQLIDETVVAEVSEIQHEEYGLMCHDQMILQRYFERWLQSTRRKIGQRKLLQSTPIWITTETRAQRTQQLQHPREAENLQMIKRYRFGEACDFKQLLAVISGSIQHPPIDLFKIFAKHATQRQPEKNGHTYFKLLLMLPGEMEEMPGFNFMCNRWLQKYLPSQSDNNDVYINACKNNVALCVRKITGTIPVTEMGQRVSNECDHADAVIFLMSADNLRNTRRRLHHLLKLSKLYKPLPIAVVVYNANNLDERQLESYLELDNFVDECCISNFKFYGCLATKNDFDFYGNLRSAARFVARESSCYNTEAESLEMQSLYSWFELALGEEMWQRWHATELNNPIFAKICSMPQFVVALYNEALQRLQEIVTEDMQEAPEFPNELRQHVPKLKHDILVGLEYFPQDWKSAARSEKILKFLKDIALPSFDEQQLLVEDIEQIELFMLNYASRCIPNDDLGATQVSYQAIKLLIELLNSVDTIQQPQELSARLSTVSWLQIIKSYAFAIFQNKLESNAYTLPREIIYRRQTFNDYQQLPWWLNFAPLDAVTVDYSLDDTMEDHDDNAQATAVDVDAIIAKASAASRKAEKQIRRLKLRNAASKPLHDELTRELDESFLQFELAKKCGTYSLAYKAAILQDDDIEVLQSEISPMDKKRRRVDEHPTEVDVIMAKAFALIEKVETQQEHREKTRNKLSMIDSN